MSRVLRKVSAGFGVAIDLATANYSGFGAICACATADKYVYVYREGTSHVGAGDHGIIRMKTTTDRGATWSAAATLFSEAGIDLRNIALGATAAGRLMLAFARYEPDDPASWLSIVTSYSDDDGANWSAAATLTLPVGVTSFSPYGAIIAVDGSLYQLGWYGKTSTMSRVYVCTSADNGATWGTSVLVAEGTSATAGEDYTETSFAHIGAGQIVAVARIDSPATTWRQFKSADNGATWTDQGAVDFAPGATYCLPVWLVAADSLSGVPCVLMYYTDRTSMDRSCIGAVAADLFAAGPSAWDAASIQSSTGNAYYPSAAHPTGLTDFGLAVGELDASAADRNSISMTAAMRGFGDPLRTALTYTRGTQFDRTGGTVGMRIKPGWAGDDGLQHTVAGWDNDAGEGVYIEKAADDKWHMTLLHGTTEHYAESAALTFARLSEHHIIGSWGATGLASLVYDGVDGTPTGAAQIPNAGFTTYRLGSATAATTVGAEAVVGPLFLSPLQFTAIDKAALMANSGALFDDALRLFYWLAYEANNGVGYSGTRLYPFADSADYYAVP